MKYHVSAWGSDIHPNLDYRTDDYPAGLSLLYPMVNVALLKTIPWETIEGGLSDQEAFDVLKTRH